MARDFEFGSAQYINVGKTTMTVGLDGKAACSMSAIINIESFNVGGSELILFINTSSGGQGALVFGILGGAGDNPGFLGARSGIGDGFQQVTTDGDLSTATEYVLSGYVDIANDTIRMYVDGSPHTEANVAFGNVVFNTGIPGSDIAIGANLTVPGQYWDGTIAELAIWDVKLTADEFAMLADRYIPGSIRPGNIVGYWRLIRGLNDLSAIKANGTATGTTIVPHPRIIEEGSTRGVWAISAPPAETVSTSIILFHQAMMRRVS